MLERIRFTTHRGKRILLVDLSNCTASEVQEIVRALPEHVSTQPRHSVLILSDFTGAQFDEEALRAMKEAAVFDKPFVEKTAWLGAGNLPASFSASIEKYSRREFPTFENRDDALAWLVKD